MSYKISRIETLEEIIYKIDFVFSKQKARVSITAYKDELSTFYCKSETDGYHWFCFWLAQEPNAKRLIYKDIPYMDRKEKYEMVKKEKEKVFAMFEAYGFDFRPEDKETFFLSTINNDDINHKIVEDIANIIEPRFAVRERFFDI